MTTAFDIDGLLTADRCLIIHNHSGTKKSLLECISQQFHNSCPNIKSKVILSSLQNREKLGSTYMNHGVAIPHGRVDDLHGPIATLLLLKPGIAYGQNNESADIVLALLAPKDADEHHIQALSAFADRLCNEAYRQRLRQAQSNQDLFLAAVTALDNYSPCEI